MDSFVERNACRLSLPAEQCQGDPPRASARLTGVPHWQRSSSRRRADPRAPVRRPHLNVEVRPFARSDRDQVTALANAHVAAVIPNVSISVNALMSQLEREPGEFLVDPWVRERVTLVAIQRSRVVAAAHLLRYGDDEHVSDSYRGTGEIRWLLCWPPAPYWPDSVTAAEALVSSCLAQLARWRPTTIYASGDLPAPGVYGVPEQWPHIRDIYLGSGFPPRGRVDWFRWEAAPASPRCSLARSSDTSRSTPT